MICVYISQEKVMFKGLLFITDGSHTDDGILKVLQLYRNVRVGSIFKTLCLDVDFVVFFEYSNCFYCLPHCISTLEIIINAQFKQNASMYLSKINCT